MPSHTPRELKKRTTKASGLSKVGARLIASKKKKAKKIKKRSKGSSHRG